MEVEGSDSHKRPLLATEQASVSPSAPSLPVDTLPDKQKLLVCTDAEVLIERRRAGSHWLMTGLVAANYGAVDMGAVLLYMLLTESTLGCDYVSTYATMQVIQLSIALVWRPVSGWITDRFAKTQHVVLMVCSVIELVTLIIMCFIARALHGFNPWYILGINIVKNIVEIQLYNSIWKILKMRLEYRFGLGCGVQCAVLSSVGVMGELLELVYNALTTGISWFLIDRYNVPFATTRLIYFGASTFGGIICVALSLKVLLDPNYFLGEPDDHTTKISFPVADEPVSDPSRNSSTELDADSDDGPSPAPQTDTLDLSASDRTRSVSYPVESVSRASSSDSSAFKAHRRRFASLRAVDSMDELEYDSADEDWLTLGTDDATASAVEQAVTPSLGLCSRLALYVRQSSRYMWFNAIARGMLLHQLLLYVSYSIAGNAEYFAVPGKHTSDDNKTMANYCGGYLTNTIFQDFTMNLVYISGVGFYKLVLKRMRPIDYVKTWYPVIMLVLAGGATLIWFHLSQLVLALALSACVAYFWFLFMYDRFVAIANVSHKRFGFYSILNGYIQTVTDLIVFLAVKYKVNNDILLVIEFCFIFLSIVYSLYFGRASWHGLAQSSRGYC